MNILWNIESKCVRARACVCVCGVIRIKATISLFGYQNIFPGESYMWGEAILYQLITHSLIAIQSNKYIKYFRHARLHKAMENKMN